MTEKEKGKVLLAQFRKDEKIRAEIIRVIGNKRVVDATDADIETAKRIRREME